MYFLLLHRKKAILKICLCCFYLCVCMQIISSLLLNLIPKGKVPLCLEGSSNVKEKVCFREHVFTLY